MKKKLLLLSLSAVTILNAGGWEDILKGAEGTKQTLKDDGANHSTSLYNANITYSVNNNDGVSGNLQGNDTAIITITSNGKTITTGTALTKDQLKTWSEQNANSIITAVFGGDPAATLGGQNSATLSSVGITQALTSISNNEKKNSLTLGTGFRSKILMSSESATIKDDKTDIKSTSGLFTYAKDLENKDALGFLLSYRYTKAEDKYDSKTASLALAPFYTIKTNLAKNFDLDTTVNILMNMVYLESSIFPDGAGYLEYGGGLGLMPKYHFTKKLKLNLNTSYQYIQKYIPDSVVPEDAQWLSDAINNLKPLQALNYGIGLTYKLTSTWTLNTNALQVKQLVTDDIKEGRDTSTYYTTSATKDWKKWQLGLGYKIVQNVKDYDEDTYMLSLKYKW